MLYILLVLGLLYVTSLAGPPLFIACSKRPMGWPQRLAWGLAAALPGLAVVAGWGLRIGLLREASGLLLPVAAIAVYVAFVLANPAPDASTR